MEEGIWLQEVDELVEPICLPGIKDKSLSARVLQGSFAKVP